MSSLRYNPSLHRIALLTAAATFPLIFMGGLVTSHGAGMSVPDWPNSYGYNMFTFPPSKWVGGIFYEHTHRLAGAVVGMLSIALTVVALKVETRRWVRHLSIIVLVAVILQGVLGGLRVVLVELDLAIVHACFAQAFFCLTALMCVATSNWWLSPARDTGVQPVRGNVTLVKFAAFSVVLIFAQLFIGAMMRYYDAGLAIPDVPLSYGQALPPTSEQALAQANQHRAWELHLPQVTMSQMWLHFGHRVGAVVVSGLLVALVVATFRANDRQTALRNPAIAIAGLLIAQVTLGVLTVLMRKPADIASAHVAVGALLLMTTFVYLVRACRLYVKLHGLPARASTLEMEPHGLVARATAA